MTFAIEVLQSFKQFLYKQLVRMDRIGSAEQGFPAPLGDKLRELPAASPTSVDQPGSGAMLCHLLCKHGCILHGVPHEEGTAKAGAEGSLWLSDTLLRASYLQHTTQTVQPCKHAAHQPVR